MGRINRANMKKTIYYLKRNGLGKTWYAVRERLEEKKQRPYIWTPPSEAELEVQRTVWGEKGWSVTFSILVPAYRTKPEYLRELIDSLCRQTYPKWELILADATEDDSVERVVRSICHSGEAEICDNATDSCNFGKGVIGSSNFGKCVSCSFDARIQYIHLPQNAGIAGNSNQALSFVTGDYVGLLDHDDVLTENALYEMAAAIEEGRQQGLEPQMLYSDEDKCNGDRTEYYEPNFKEDFNLDLLLSNNYICHFLVMKRELIQKLKFRPEYNGAQDYDLVLRAAAQLKIPITHKITSELEASAERNVPQELKASAKPGKEEGAIVHIPKVLYHWRCHTGSTAENPHSKSYAYEAGRQAVQDFAEKAGWRAKAVDTAHVGFYTLQYKGSVFDSRPDVGAIGGRLVHKGRIVSGRMTQEGKVLYAGLPIHYSGYLHRAVLPQDACAVDLRNIQVRPECRELFLQITGVPYQAAPGTDIFDASLLPGDCDICRVSLEFGRALRDAGYRILYLPERTIKL